MPKKRSGFISGLIAGIVATALIGAAFAEYWFFGDSATANLQPAAGGLQLVETPTVVADASGQTQLPTETPNPYVAGQNAVATALLLLYADAGRNSLILDELAAGSTVTISAPSGEYSTYPVAKEGQLWVRVRSQDGLVGWVNANLLAIN